MVQTTSTQGTITTEIESVIRNLIDTAYIQQKVALIQGVEGTGKQRIIEQISQTFDREIYTVKVSCTQISSNVPYYAYRMIVQAFIQKLLLHDRLELIQKIYAEFVNMYSVEAFSNLEAFIPELKGVITKTTSQQVKRLELPNTENSLQYFRTFMELCFQEIDKTVVFVIEKVEWLDSSSSFFLKSIIKEWNIGKAAFLLLTSLGEKEAISNNFINTISEYCTANFRISMATKADFERILALKLAPNHVHPEVSNELYRITEGEIQDLSSIINWLENKRLIWLSDGLWCTDAFALRKHLKAQSAESLLKDRLARLPQIEQKILTYIAIMQESDLSLLALLLDLSLAALHRHIKTLIDADFLYITEQGKYEFEELHHNKLLYELIPLAKRNKIHFEIGAIAWKNAMDSHQAFFAVHHLNHGSSHALKNNDNELLAEANLSAGNLALNTGILTEARHYFRMAEMHLNFNETPQHYHLYYQIISKRAQLEYLLKNYDYADLRLEDLLKPNYPLEDRMKVYAKKIKLNNHLGRYSAARDVLLKALEVLGFENFFKSASSKIRSYQEQLDQEMQHISALFTDDAHKEEMPERSFYKNTLLYNAGIAIHHTSEEEMLLSNLSIIVDGLKYKKTGEIAVACCVYARFLFTQQQDMERAIIFGKLGLKLAQSINDPLAMSRAYGIFAFYVLPWKRSLEENLSLLGKGAEIAEKESDYYLHSILQTHAYTQRLLIGNNLDEIAALGETLQAQKSPTAYNIAALNHFIKFIQGKTNSLSKESVMMPTASLHTKNEALFFESFSKGLGLFHLGLYSQSTKEFECAYQRSVLQKGSLLHSFNTLFLGLSLALIERNQKQEELFKYLEKRLIRREKNTPNTNQEIVLSPLLKAVYESSRGTYKEADLYFETFLSQEKIPLSLKALGYELQFIHLVKTQRANAEILDKAIETYKAWGAKHKADILLQSYRKYISSNTSKTDNTFKLYLEFQTMLEGVSNIEEINSFATKYLFRLTSADYASIYLYHKDHFILLSKGDNKTSKSYYYPPKMRVKGYSYQLNLAYQTKLEQRILYNEENLNFEIPSEIENYFSVPMNSGYFLGLIQVENVAESSLNNQDLKNQLQLFAGFIATKIRQALSIEKEKKLHKQLVSEIEKKELLNLQIKEKNKEWLRATIEGQEKERLRIAQDLHDSVGAMLGAVKLNIQNVFDDEKDAQIISPILRQIDEVCQDIRRISHNMLPSALTRFGLSVSLERLIEQYQLQNEFEIEYSAIGLEEAALSQDAEISIFRIIQESLQNIQKYARCTEVCVQLIARDDALSIYIADDGCGFDTNTTSKGIGLLNIESRIIALEGDLAIDSSLGRGTELNIEIPLNTK